jgi:hypothetical protein
MELKEGNNGNEVRLSLLPSLPSVKQFFGSANSG